MDNLASIVAALHANVESTRDRCVACGSAAAPGKTLLKCMLCSDRKLPGGYYCSRKCQKADWKAHKAWHKLQASVTEQHEHDQQTAPPQAPVAADKQAEVDEAAVANHAYYIRMLEPSLPTSEALTRAKSQLLHSRTPTGDLLLLYNKAAELRDEGDLSKATRGFKMAIKLEPLSPYAYDALADVLSRSHNGPGAASAWMQAMDRYPTCCLHWATCVARVYDILNRPLPDKPPFPSWWNDDSLKTLSKLVVGATRPDETNVSTADRVYALAMRAEVLSCIGPPRLIMGHVSMPQWTLGSRTLDELREGGEYFSAAAKLASSATYPAKAMKVGFVIAAVACFKRSKDKPNGTNDLSAAPVNR